MQPYYFFVLDSSLDSHVSAEMLHSHEHTVKGGVSGGHHPELKVLLQALLADEPDGRRMSVLDVGANVGSFALHAASLGLRVFAFEMQPELATLLELSKRVNGYKRMRVHNAALWNASGVPITFTPLDGNLGGTAARTDGSGAKSIISSTLSDHFYHGKVFLLKLDCERAEQYVLAGFAKHLASGHVRHLLMEASQHQRHIYEWLYSIGFRCGVDDVSRHVASREEFMRLTSNPGWLNPGWLNNILCTFEGPVLADPPTLQMRER